MIHVFLVKKSKCHYNFGGSSLQRGISRFVPLCPFVQKPVHFFFNYQELTF